MWWHSSTPHCSRSSDCPLRSSRRDQTYVTRSGDMRASSLISSQWGQPATRIAALTRARNTGDRYRNRSRLTRMIRQSSACSSACWSISRACWSGSVQCWGPSYCTPTFHSGHPISMRATKSPYSLQTTICVLGRGNPALMSNNLVRVSYGDSAPPSMRSTTFRSWTIPRAPLWRSASALTSSGLRPVAFANASSWMTATT
jgi:hypothetical protein